MGVVMPRQPTGEQRAAIEARGHDVLLEAGAGTGKTGVLVDRYCDLVAGEEASPDAILAFTYTDKAAAQLRERIRAELARRAAADPDARERLAAIVAGFGGAWVTTIHGFCRRLLAAHPIAAGIDPGFRVLDESEAARAALAAFDTALEAFLAGGDQEREATVAAYRVDGLREMVFSAHEELRSRGQDRPQLPDPRPGDLDAALAALQPCAEALLAAGGDQNQVRKAERALDLCRDRAQRAPTLDDLALLAVSGKTDVKTAYNEALTTAISRAAEAGEGGVAYEHVRELLGLFHDSFGRQKSARSGLDFEDLQLHAVRLLEGSEIGDSYRDRFSNLLVDEFQDTNRLQLKLLSALRGPGTNVFLVGDEFQSIYGFRHADLEVFRGQRQRFEAAAEAEVMPLSGNFRSRPEVVATANAIGDAMLGPEFKGLTVGDNPTSGEAAGGGAAVEVLLTAYGGWDEEGIDLALPVDDRTSPRIVAEARFLATRLGELHEAGVPRGEMVVLLRAFTHVDAFEEALQRAGLRPYVVGGRGYWSQQQVEDVRCLLSVIANPLDDEPLLGALASPACGVLPDTLWILRRAAGGGKHLWPALERAVGAWEPDLAEPEWLEQIPDGDRKRLERFHATVSALRAERPRLPLDELVERTVVDTGYDLAVLARGPAELRMANVRKLMRMSREFESTEGRDLRGFLDFVAFRSGEDAEAVAATEAEDHDGVRVMTIHTAKGLEFPVVAVAGLGRGLLGGGRPVELTLGPGEGGEERVGMRLARLGMPWVEMYESIALKEEGQIRGSAEELRLFYVAVTRARERLLLSGVLAANRPAELRPGTCVAERLVQAWAVSDLDADTAVTLPAPPARPGLDVGFDDVEVPVRVNLPSPERAAELRRLAAAGPAAAEVAGGPTPIVAPLAPVTPQRPLSYSALEEYRRCGYRFYMERVLGLAAGNGAAAGASAGAGARFGSAVHSLLEWSAKRRWIEPPDDVVARMLAAEGLEADGDRQRAREMVLGWIESPLREKLSERGTDVSVEVPLLVELGGSILRGKIDLLGKPINGPPTVVDFKTDRLDGDDPGSRGLRYQVQRDLYAIATAEATRSETVRVAYVFLERPGEPVVQELGPPEMEAARAELEATVGQLAAGSFEVTAAPTWELCRDCPARRRLCSNPASPPGR
jgi:ATP-dependent helicase/nuclease subunit A